MAKVKYALISPTFKRPDEVTEFLSSLESLDYPKEEFQLFWATERPMTNYVPYFRPTSKPCP